MSRIIKPIILCIFLHWACSSVEEAGDNMEVRPAGQVCTGRGKSMMQISSLHTALPSWKKSIPGIIAQDVRELVHTKAQSQCERFSSVGFNSSAASLDSVGFASLQSLCCGPEMANFIVRLIEKDGNRVCNVGALNGLASHYDCPGDKSFAELSTDISSNSPAQSGDCAWIRSSQAQTCPTMQPTCLNYPQAPAPVAPSFPPPSAPATGPQPVGPPAPPPATSVPCNILSTTPTTTPASATTTMDLVVPLYKWPDMGQNGSMYDAVADSSVQTLAIINPGNGDSNQCSGAMPRDAIWQSVVSLFDQKPLVRTLGYVHTNYSNRALADVKLSVDNYYACWGVAGIFVDEASTAVSHCSGSTSYYKELYNYIKSKESSTIVMTNQGTGVDFDTWKHCSTSAMIAEVPLATWQSQFHLHGAFAPQGSTTAYPDGYAVVLVYGVPSESKMQEVIRQAACEQLTNATGIMVVSNGGPGNPPSYNQLPAYFNSLVTYMTASWNAECPSASPYTVATTGGACWWNVSDTNCEVCSAGSNQCSFQGCYKHQCAAPGGSGCSNPCR